MVFDWTVPPWCLGVSIPTAQKHIPHSIPPGLCSIGSSNIRWLLSEPRKQQLLIKPPLTYSWSSMIFSPCGPCIRTYCLDLSVYYLWISSLPFLSRFSNYVLCFATSSIRFFGIFVEWSMVSYVTAVRAGVPMRTPALPTAAVLNPEGPAAAFSKAAPFSWENGTEDTCSILDGRQLEAPSKSIQ